jgi:hypothetical protein
MLNEDYIHGQQILQDSQPILTQLKALSQSARMRFSRFLAKPR